MVININQVYEDRDWKHGLEPQKAFLKAQVGFITGFQMQFNTFYM